MVSSGQGETCASVRPDVSVQGTITSKGAGNDSFKASKGWLQSFKQRHNIVQLVVSGEAGDVRQDTVDPGWNDFRLLCKGMLQRIYGMRMRLLASFKLFLRGH